MRAALEGKVLDCPPVALWRHFPAEDSTAEGLARAVLEFQREFDFDLVKVTPASGYMAEAWGAQLVPKNNPEGTREYLTRLVHSSKEWLHLKKLDHNAGVLGRELKALTLIRSGLSENTPIDAFEQTSRKNLILGAGCVIPITVPKANVHAAAHFLE